MFYRMCWLFAIPQRVFFIPDDYPEPCALLSFVSLLYIHANQIGINYSLRNMHKIILLAPKCGQTGDNLFLSAHYLRQKHFVILGCHTKRLPNYLVIANIQKLAAFQEHIRQHQNQ